MSIHRQSSLLVAAVAAAAIFATGLGAQEACPAPPAHPGVLDHVRYLADDALEGRLVASPGGHCAADYLAARFREMGLEPAGEDGSWFQPFPVRTGSALGGENGLEISTRSLGLGKAWSPFGFSGSGRVEAPLAYAGAGVARPGTDEELPEVEGRVAVVEARTPGAGGVYSDPHFKASVAAGRGATALVVLLDGDDPLPDLAGEDRPASAIPVVAVTGEAADEVRRAARSGETATVRTDVVPVLGAGRNVVALLPGTGETADHLVLGAHYDHLGRGGEGSLAPDSREVHNGADDNASGTAALLAVAADLPERRPERSVLFVAFDGEEQGLLGSAHYVENPSLPLEDAVAMINMDMVGRLRDELTIYGVATAEEWPDLLARVNAATGDPLALSLLPDGFGPSDHSSFYGKGVPVLHFFTNTHADYHRPSDDWQTIDAAGIERIVSLVSALTAELAGTGDTASGRVADLTPLAGAGNPHAGGVPSSDPSEPSQGRGYGPYFGSIPDMTPVEHGVRLTGVREDSPAERAGLKAGDVVVGFGGKDVSDLYAYTYALRDHRPGDRVQVVVLRDGERLTLQAVLGERR